MNSPYIVKTVVTISIKMIVFIFKLSPGASAVPYKKKQLMYFQREVTFKQLNKSQREIICLFTADLIVTLKV